MLAGAATQMQLDGRGDLRPVPAVEPGAVPPLASYCPAIRVRRPAVPGARVDQDFGPWLGAWSAHATDPEIRHRGSSGGALTALAGFAIATGEADEVALVRGAAGSTRSQAYIAGSASSVAAGASSRYAPVSTLALLAGRSDLQGLAVVARPCEASALRALVGSGPRSPIILSFFCAGVPSQRATEQLIAQLGVDPRTATAVRYRGEGWPGSFRVTDASGTVQSASYEQSWGEVLGRDLQARCKVCVDGVGESADVVAADLWEADERGYPRFTAAPGQSLLVARTPRGMALVRAAVDSGWLSVIETDLEHSRTVQQLQVTRRRFLPGRLLGRRAAGYANPSYAGFALWRQLLRHPMANLRQAPGSFARGRADRSRRAPGVRGPSR